MMRVFIMPLIIVVVFILGAVVLMSTAPVLEPTATKPVPTTVRVLEVKPRSVQLSVHSQGSVMPSTESRLIPEVSGRVVWMSPSLVAGGYFKQGQLLARVDDVDYRNSLERARLSNEPRQKNSMLGMNFSVLKVWQSAN